MAKRIAGSSVNWESISQMCKTDKGSFLAFKSKTDKYLKRVTEKSPDLPKIDWAYYKARVASPSFLDSFQKSYESFKIPYPSDQGFFAQLENKEKEHLNEYRKDMQELDRKISENEQKLSKLNQEIPLSRMSMEELFIARPELAFNPDKPKMWPPNYSEDYLRSEKDN